MGLLGGPCMLLQCGLSCTRPGACLLPCSSCKSCWDLLSPAQTAPDASMLLCCSAVLAVLHAGGTRLQSCLPTSSNTSSNTTTSSSQAVTVASRTAKGVTAPGPCSDGARRCQLRCAPCQACCWLHSRTSCGAGAAVVRSLRCRPRCQQAAMDTAGAAAVACPVAPGWPARAAACLRLVARQVAANVMMLLWWSVACRAAAAAAAAAPC